jgi:hypothetical protein
MLWSSEATSDPGEMKLHLRRSFAARTLTQVRVFNYINTAARNELITKRIFECISLNGSMYAPLVTSKRAQRIQISG